RNSKSRTRRFSRARTHSCFGFGFPTTLASLRTGSRKPSCMCACARTGSARLGLSRSATFTNSCRSCPIRRPPLTFARSWALSRATSPHCSPVSTATLALSGCAKSSRRWFLVRRRRRLPMDRERPHRRSLRLQAASPPAAAPLARVCGRRLSTLKQPERGQLAPHPFRHGGEAGLALADVQRGVFRRIVPPALKRPHRPGRNRDHGSVEPDPAAADPVLVHEPLE